MIGDFSNASNGMFGLTKDQQSYVDETNKLFENLPSSFDETYKDISGKNYVEVFSKLLGRIFNLGGQRDMKLQDYNRKLDILLENTAIRRRVADALQSGVNPIFALGANGAGSGSVASQPMASKRSMLDTLLKVLLGITFLAK